MRYGIDHQRLAFYREAKRKTGDKVEVTGGGQDLQLEMLYGSSYVRQAKIFIASSIHDEMVTRKALSHRDNTASQVPYLLQSGFTQINAFTI